MHNHRALRIMSNYQPQTSTLNNAPNSSSSQWKHIQINHKGLIRRNMKLGSNEFKVCRFRYLYLNWVVVLLTKLNVHQKWTISRNICYKWYLNVTKQFFDNILSITKANSLILSFHYSKKVEVYQMFVRPLLKKICHLFYFFLYNSDLSFFFSETPLSLAVCLKSKSSKMVISLVNGGAIVDFRNKLDGSTALHRTVAKSNIESLQTLLDLGKVFTFF